MKKLRLFKIAAVALIIGILTIITFGFLETKRFPKHFLGEWCTNFSGLPPQTSWEFETNGVLVLSSKEQIATHRNNDPIHKIGGKWAIINETLHIQLPFLGEIHIELSTSDELAVVIGQDKYILETCLANGDRNHSHKFVYSSVRTTISRIFEYSSLPQ